jgi:hypothetical protein
MIFKRAPLFQTRIRPHELALLIRYLEEAARTEKSTYLSEFLTYIVQVVLWSPMDEHMSTMTRNLMLEQAKAILSEARARGEPYFWTPPNI